MSGTRGSRLDRTGNLLGALALSIADRTADAIASASGHSESSGIALSALDDFLDGPTVDRLRQVLGLTPSGAVRLLDRLEAAGKVVRRSGGDGRSRSVRLTPSGRRTAARVRAARAEVLESALSVLDAHERELLGDLLGRVLVELIRGPGHTRWMCRLCDTGACGRPDGRCPVATAAHERYA